MSSKDTQFKPGERHSIATEFKPGQHWRKPQAFRDAAWLTREYVELQRSASDIGKQFGVGDSAIQFWLKKHGIATRTTAQARVVKRWGVSGSANGSLLFPTLAFGALLPGVVLAQFVAKVAGGALWSLLLRRGMGA